MKDDKDPLDDLIVDEDAKPDLNLIAEILKGNAKLNNSGEIILESGFKELPNWKQILIYFIAKKAIVIKKLGENSTEWSMPREIGDAIYLDRKTVGKRLARELKSLVTKTKEGYFIPNYNLLKAKQIFLGEIPLSPQGKKSKNKK